MSATRSPSSPNTAAPSKLSSSSPLDLSPISTPEKHHSSQPSSPASPLDNRQVAPRPVNERGSLDDVTLLNVDNTDSSNLGDTDSNAANANGGSSPMELVDDEMGGQLELEGSDEYIDGYDMQDLRRVKVRISLFFTSYNPSNMR
jgi:hypothetical protein